MTPNARRLIVATALLATPGAAPQPAPVPPLDQAAQYAADVPKTILELQQFRSARSIAIDPPARAPASRP